MGGIVQTLIDNWERVSSGLLLLLLLIAFGFLFFSDKLLSPKSVERLIGENVALKKQNTETEVRGEEAEKALYKAAQELADARVLYVKADARLEHMDSLMRIKDNEITDIRGRMGRLEGELEGMRQWRFAHPQTIQPGEPR